VAPSAKNQELGSWQYKPSFGRFLFRENTKNKIFRESEHHASLVWRLAANWVPLGGSCSSKNPAALPLRLRTSVFPSFPWHADFHLFSCNPASNYCGSYPQRIHYQFSKLVQTLIILVTFNPKDFNSNKKFIVGLTTFISNPM